MHTIQSIGIIVAYFYQAGVLSKYTYDLTIMSAGSSTNTQLGTLVRCALLNRALPSPPIDSIEKLGRANTGIIRCLLEVESSASLLSRSPLFRVGPSCRDASRCLIRCLHAPRL